MTRTCRLLPWLWLLTLSVGYAAEAPETADLEQGLVFLPVCTGDP